jgi:pyruvate kinase
MRRTKILATVGPASASPERLSALISAGADAFRLNFSHGSDAEHRTALRRIHSAARGFRKEVAVVGDVPGPKIRLGEIAGGSVRLTSGRPWVLDDDAAPGNDARAGIQIPSFAQVAKRGDPVLLGDGSVELVVEKVLARSLETRVRNGGIVSSHTGLFLPRARLRTSVFAAEDRTDAALGLSEGMDYLALSFVRNGEDLAEARHWLDRNGGEEVGLIAKIERAEALQSIDSILGAADGIMVARGDLGIEVPLERLALEQKRLVRRANLAGKFAVVATQMLLSMLNAPRPTRAEATDVANAVLDGADAVMLSEESAVGQYPVESVRWLDRIARATEPAVDARPWRSARIGAGAERAVAAAAVELAEGVRAKAIVTPTHSGRTARLVARLHPSCPVVAISSLPSTRRKLALVGGVASLPAPLHRDLVELRTEALALVERAGIRGPSPIVLTAGYPVEGRPTNLVTLVDSAPARPVAPRGGGLRASSPGPAVHSPRPRAGEALTRSRR